MVRLTWPSATQFFFRTVESVRKRVQLSQDCFEWPTWRPLHCFRQQYGWCDVEWRHLTLSSSSVGERQAQFSRITTSVSGKSYTKSIIIVLHNNNNGKWTNGCQLFSWSCFKWYQNVPWSYVLKPWTFECFLFRHLKNGISMSFSHSVNI